MNYKEALSKLSRDEQQSLLSQLESADFSGQITGFDHSLIELAHALLPLASTFSIAPVSSFNVGSVAVGASGALYLGTNLEFVGTPLSGTLHAEQSAVLNARGHGETSLTALAISEAPCGFCRQFLAELSEVNQLSIMVKNTHTDLNQLLPMQFGDARQRGQGLLDSSALTLKTNTPNGDEHSRLAIESARHSYTPYTQAPEGFVVECANGKQFTGSTTESIAFNPSVPAVLCALNQRNLSNSRNEAITYCAHARLQGALNSSDALATSIMRSLTDVEIQTVLLEQEQ